MRVKSIYGDIIPEDIKEMCENIRLGLYKYGKIKKDHTNQYNLYLGDQFYYFASENMSVKTAADELIHNLYSNYSGNDGVGNTDDDIKNWRDKTNKLLSMDLL